MSTILVVDDSAFMRSTIRKMLEKNNFNVVGEAENGRIGVAKYKELMPDVVTLDVIMSEMDGIAALKEIMAHNPQAMVMMVSSMGQLPYVKEAITLGAKGFIVKPFSEKQIIDDVSRLLNK